MDESRPLSAFDINMLNIHTWEKKTIKTATECESEQ